MNFDSTFKILIVYQFILKIGSVGLKNKLLNILLIITTHLAYLLYLIGFKKGGFKDCVNILKFLSKAIGRSKTYMYSSRLMTRVTSRFFFFYDTIFL